ncbi:PQQ-binding-like beta-propeller repeat protein [Xylophilus rhododendri]|uniref:PQQ-binding-like beta-propeller repeat protein n=1 Tax=Xylophilus rhododendri TaxID=2697032 RepID=A0A857J7U3_9BURK|nr:PQQ-binding-like beta-propeller repeat protein [Xylophilus rhododendri]QHI99141.1 PQQ-binding-like beta-propeller repeat protein [Xylophilus rhododendri]
MTDLAESTPCLLQQTELQAQRESLRQAIVRDALRLGPTLTFDLKRVLTQAGLCHTAGRLLWQAIRHLQPRLLIGPGFGGLPLAYAVAHHALEADGVDLALWLVRDKRKTYYSQRWIEGPELPADVRAVVIDDFLGAGSVLDLVEQAMADEKRQARLCGLGVLLDNWTPLGSRQIGLRLFPVLSVFRRHDLGLSRDCFDARPPDMQGAAPPFVRRMAWWRFAFNGHTRHPFKSSPAVADDSVFAVDDGGTAWRFDGASGEALWRTPPAGVHYKGVVQRLQHVDGSIVYGSYDGTLTRLCARSGAIVWRLRVDSSVHATSWVDAASGRLFINTEQSNRGEPCGHLQALDWACGRPLWRRPQAFWPPGSPVFDRQAAAVLATANDGLLVCVDAASGELRWSVQTQGLVRGQPVVTPDRRVAVATEDGHLQAFDLATGALLASRPYGPGLRHQVLLSSASCLYAFDARSHLLALRHGDLALQWLSRLRSPGAVGPLRWGRYLLVLSEEGHLAVFDESRGLKLWEGAIKGQYRQLPALGTVAGRPVLACASEASGLLLYEIDAFYGDSPDA